MGSSLRLPKKAPACFESQEQWNQYRELAVQSARDGFTFCVDCTAEYRDKMKQANRCRYPRTEFEEVAGVLVGRRVG